MQGHATSALGSSAETPVAHPTGAGLYQENVTPGPHHLAGPFPGAQISPMASPYAYGAAQHPMYGASYSGHAYAPYPGYIGHLSHYGHPPHYPGASSSPAYHAPVMSGMIPPTAYGPHTTASHLPSHHAAMPMAMASTSAAGTASPAPGAMAPNAMIPASPYGTAPHYGAQMAMPGRHRVTTTLWEDEGTLCFQVDVKGVCVARRHDNNMVNGTKLLNVCGMSRGKRDGILKNEKERIVVKVGAMHLKGVWIAFNRGKQLAEQHGIADALYPLFEPNIQSFLYHPDNYPRTAAVMAAAQERQVQRHYSMPAPSNGTPIKELPAPEPATGMPLPAGIASSHWSGPQQTHETPGSADATLHYPYQSHPHYQQPQHHPAPAVSAQVPGNSAVFSPPGTHYPPGLQPPMRPVPSTNMNMERRLDSAPEATASMPPSTPISMPPPQRRIPSMKRSTDDYEASQDTAEAAQAAPDAEVADGQAPGEFGSTLSGSKFAVDDAKANKRVKTEGQNPAFPNEAPVDVRAERE